MAGAKLEEQISIVRFGALNNRFDPEYYSPYNLRLAQMLNRVNPQTIDSFADVTDGIHGSPQWVEEDGITYLSAKSVKNGQVVIDTAGTISKEQHEANPRTQARVGDVIVSSVGTIGNAAVIEDYVLPANMDRHLGIIRINGDSVDPYYLSAFLNCEFGKFQTLRESTGNVQLNLFIEKIKTLLVPVGDDFNAVGELIRNASEQRKESKRLYAEAEGLLLAALGLDGLDLSPQLSYTAMFDEVATAERFDPQYFQPQYRTIHAHLNKRFPVDQIEQWGKVLKGRSVKYSETSKGIPIVRSGDLTDLNSAEDFKVAFSDQQIFFLRKGDVLISSIGFGSIGKVQVFDKQGQYGTVSEVTVIRQKQVNPYYLQVFLESVAGQLQIERWITGATGQLHLYPRDVGKIYVPIIPAEQQKEFERLIMQSRVAQDEAKQLLETAKQRVEQMILGTA